MESSFYMRLPGWLDERLRQHAEREAMSRQVYIRSLLVKELGGRP